MKLLLAEIWTALGTFAMGAMRPAAVVPVQPPADVHIPEDVQTDGYQWMRISSIVGGAVGSAANAAWLQRSAAQQLDSARYALDILKTELAVLIDKPDTSKAPAPIVPLARPLRVIKQVEPMAA